MSKIVPKDVKTIANGGLSSKHEPNSAKAITGALMSENTDGVLINVSVLKGGDLVCIKNSQHDYRHTAETIARRENILKLSEAFDLVRNSDKSVIVHTDHGHIDICEFIVKLASDTGLRDRFALATGTEAMPYYLRSLEPAIQQMGFFDIDIDKYSSYLTFFKNGGNIGIIPEYTFADRFIRSCISSQENSFYMMADNGYGDEGDIEQHRLELALQTGLLEGVVLNDPDVAARAKRAVQKHFKP